MCSIYRSPQQQTHDLQAEGQVLGICVRVFGGTGQWRLWLLAWVWRSRLGAAAVALNAPRALVFRRGPQVRIRKLQHV
jgi:hypothetical protein